ncbi:hypothetical protein QZM22_00595 [Burkholderia oklahomensis]|uniref:hypothetical protein n=1 Tax=Burkholderia oklahomensis TaxID=342113 RepID=UPI00264C9C2C|nr:hypothetical protein [Burkholderia oklahomensis]MDN7671059.1 hypothetical protein [Burkholderia oklahomensis]
MPQMPDDAGLPLNANGSAYTSRQDRDDVPLSYVGKKLGLAIADLHRHACRCQGERDDLRCAVYHLLMAYLGPHNVLGKSNDRTLVDRLLDGSSEKLDKWLRLVERVGDVQGRAELGN